MSDSAPPRTLDTERPHSARMYDYLLGGKDHFDADQEAAENALVVQPHIRVTAQQNRAFMHRATRMLAREYGIRQWLDVGTGIPTEPNLHQVAQSVAPEARVVYADNDPLVLRYAERLMRSAPEGRTAYVHADFSEPDAILDAPELRNVLDLGKPVALSLNALLHFVPNDRDPHRTVRHLLDAFPSGSALAVTHVTADFDPETWERIADLYTKGGTPVQCRVRDEVVRFFDGLDLVDPGIIPIQDWHPEYADPSTPQDPSAYTNAQISLYGGVGLKV